MPESDIERLQTEITAKLNSGEYFADVTVVSLRKLVIDYDIESANVYLTAKGGKRGVGVIVGMPSVSVPSPNVPGPEIHLRIPVRVKEDPTTNQNLTSGGTGKTAEAVALKVQATLHRFQINGLAAIYAGERGAQSPFSISPNTDEKGIIAYDVFFEAVIAMEQFEQCGVPTASFDAGFLTLTNTTSGATIYFTNGVALDGTPGFPWSGGESVFEYTGPFEVPGQNWIVRFAAYKTGMNGSDVDQITIS